MADALLSSDEFAAKIKAKYPQYQSVDNAELTQRIIAKYPQYKDQVRLSAPADTTSLTDKAMAGLGVIPNAIKQLGNTDQEPALTSSNNATQSGYQNIARGIKQGFQGFADLNAAPQTPGEKALSAIPGALQMYRSLHGIAQGTGQIGQVPQAIKDINQSPDPVGAYGNVAARTAGEGAGQAIDALAVEASPKAVGAAGDIAGNISPSLMKEKAGGLLQSVAHDANKLPVNLENSGDAALRLMDWQKKTQLGPTINKFLNRITNPKLGPLTYEEARDFYQLFGQMSVDESSKLPATVKYDLQRMTAGLKTDIGNTADQVGKAAEYYQGLGDYAKGARLQKWLDTAKKYGIKAAAAGALGAAGAEGYRLVQEANSR